jgi:NAD(P)-dependent dehydrogenase (short-subunit alcohol dehydrogenase family)
LNAVVKSAAIDLTTRGVIVVAVHPGWVRTDMGGAGADISADESAAKIFRLCEHLKPTDSGKFLDGNGDEIPW